MQELHAVDINDKVALMKPIHIIMTVPLFTTAVQGLCAKQMYAQLTITMRQARLGLGLELELELDAAITTRQHNRTIYNVTLSSEFMRGKIN